MRDVVIGVLMLSLTPRLSAQTPWTLSGEVGANRFSRAAHDTSSPAVSLGAWHSTSYTLRLAREGDRGVVAASVGYTSSPFAAWIENVAGVQGGELSFF